MAEILHELDAAQLSRPVPACSAGEAILGLLDTAWRSVLIL